LRRIHLVNPMAGLGGSELRTVGLYQALSPHARVKVWSGGAVDGRLLELVPVHAIRPGRLAFPWGGTLVFVGVFFDYGRWIRWARPERIVIIYNTDLPDELRSWCRRLRRWGHPPVEVVYASEWMKRSVQGEGPVQISPIDLARFRPGAAGGTEFTVGRLSRDIAYKHHPGDPGLYRRLAGCGIKVRLMGGTCLAGQDCGGAALLPEAAQEAGAFLRGLDCFYYRTSPRFLEAHGRVVTEAMACGLPAVCSSQGGYSDFIEHGRTGYLFRDEGEALDILLKLRDDPELRARIGGAARARMERMFSPEALRGMADFYLRSRKPWPAPGT